MRIDSPPKTLPGKPSVYVDKRELRELRRGIKEVLESFLSFFMAYTLAFSEPTRSQTARQAARQPHLKPQTRRIARPGPAWLIIKLAEIPLGLWIAAILLFGFGDSLTSALAFSVGAYEVNPLMLSLIGIFGRSIWVFVTIKTAILAALFFLSYFTLPRHGWLIPSILCIVGIYLVLNNLIAYFRMI